MTLRSLLFEKTMPLHVSEDSLDWALKHVETYGDTDIFPIPFEYQAIRHSWDSLRRYLAKQDLHVYRVRPYRRCLSPKHRFGFRISTQLDPLDTLLYSALVYEVGPDIEACRVPVGKNVVHSYRFQPDVDGRIFEPGINYNTFVQQSRYYALSRRYSHVVVADIADFYPRIYTHPTDNILIDRITTRDHAQVISKLLDQWNHTVSYGIPVGQAASRLLAELTITDVDEALLHTGRTYCRFSDDFRIFCHDEREAYRSLAFLANTLFENHGLTLQQHKTRILDVDQFIMEYLETEHDFEQNSLIGRFQDILNEIGVDSWYEEIDYDDLDAETQARIDALNLAGILKEYITGSTVDIGLVGFVLRRLRQIRDDSALDLVLEHMEALYPVVKDAVCYITAIRRLDSSDRKEIGSRLVDLIDGSVIGHLEYHRCWLLNTFTHDNEWDNENRFHDLYEIHGDIFSRRELISAMGRANHEFWFKTNKRDITQFEPWTQRAFLAAASCLPGDEAKHWYRSMYKDSDELGKAVIDWARANPY
jgi:hypothetical protein